MDGYIRVSRRMGREGPGYISKRIQREAIEHWASYRGIEIVEWHVDEDESGGTQNRPGIRAAIDRVVAGETQGIACWRLNRFARNVGEALHDVGTIQQAGGVLAFTADDIDATGPAGEFFLTVLLAIAALDLNNIKSSWRIAKEHAMARGAVIGPTAFGYARQADGTLEADPVAGPVVGQAFMIAATRGLHATVAFLTEHGPGRTWTTSTVRRMLSQRCYLGEFVYGELKHVDRDLALTDSATWHAAQPTEPKRRRRAANFPLSGLATCATCGTHMVGARGGRDRQTGAGLRSYRCAASLTAWRGERCPAPATTVADRLEQYVRDQAATAADAVAVQVADRGLLDDQVAAAARALEEAETELEAFASDLTLRRVLGDRYHPAGQVRADAVTAAREHYALLAARAATSSTRTGLGELVREAPLEELGVLLRGMLAGVEVARGRGPLAGRVRLVALDDEPAAGMTGVHHT